MANAAQHPALFLSAPAEDVRRRLAEAWAESLPSRGYHGTTVQRLVDLSGISRSVFYRHFAGKEDAFVAIHSDALAWLTARIRAATSDELGWSQQVAAGIATALEALAEQPREAQLLLGDPLSAGPRMGYLEKLLSATLSPSLSLGRRAGRTPAPPPGIEAALVGAMIGIVSDRVRSGSIRSLPALAPELAEFVLAPYLGTGEARRLTLSAARFEQAFAALRTRIESACAGEDEWPQRVAAGVGAAFEFAAEQPQTARSLTGEALARGREGQAQHRRLVSYLSDLLRSGHEPGPAPAGVPAIAEEAVTGGIALQVGRLLDAGREQELPAIAAEATQLILIPHVGLEEARRIAVATRRSDSS